MLVLLVFSLKPITTFSLSTIDCKKTIKVQNKCLTKMLQVQQFAIRQFLTLDPEVSKKSVKHVDQLQA